MDTIALQNLNPLHPQSQSQVGFPTSRYQPLYIRWGKMERNCNATILPQNHKVEAKKIQHRYDMQEKGGNNRNTIIK